MLASHLQLMDGWAGLVDVWRIVLVSFAAALAGLVARVMLCPDRRGSVAGWAWRLAALLAATVSVGFTEVGRIGHVATWRLPVNTLVIVLGIVGVWQMLGREPGDAEHRARRLLDGP